LDQIRQNPSEPANEFAARTLEMVSKAWGDIPPATQIELAIHHFVAGISNRETRDSIREQQALRNLTWTEIVKVAQAREVSASAEPRHTASAVDQSYRTSYENSRNRENWRDQRGPNSGYRGNFQGNKFFSNENRGNFRGNNFPRDETKGEGAIKIRKIIFQEKIRIGKIFFPNGNSDFRDRNFQIKGFSENFQMDQSPRGSNERNSNENGPYGLYRDKSPDRRGRSPERRRDPTPGPRGDARSGVNPTSNSRSDACSSYDEEEVESRQMSIPVTVEGLLVEDCLADTGSVKTILSYSIYERLEHKPPMRQWPRSERLLGVVGGARPGRDRKTDFFHWQSPILPPRGGHRRFVLPNDSGNG